jgi:hypothetical protein
LTAVNVTDGLKKPFVFVTTVSVASGALV